MEPAQHDYALALLSHLPHLLAYTLALEAGDTRADRALAGPAFEEFTRLALCPPDLWADIFLENRKAMLVRLRDYRAALEAMEGVLEAGDREELTLRLARARAWRT